jgi:hypothetical protein
MVRIQDNHSNFDAQTTCNRKQQEQEEQSGQKKRCQQHSMNANVSAFFVVSKNSVISIVLIL